MDVGRFWLQLFLSQCFFVLSISTYLIFSLFCFRSKQLSTFIKTSNGGNHIGLIVIYSPWSLTVLNPLFFKRKLKMTKIKKFLRENSEYLGKSKYKVDGVGVTVNDHGLYFLRINLKFFLTTKSKAFHFCWIQDFPPIVNSLDIGTRRDH